MQKRCRLRLAVKRLPSVCASNRQSIHRRFPTLREVSLLGDVPKQNLPASAPISNDGCRVGCYNVGMRFQFRLRDVLLFQVMFGIAIGAMAVYPHRYFVLPVGLTTFFFLIMGQRKVGLIYGGCFALAWVLVMVTRLVGA